MSEARREAIVIVIEFVTVMSASLQSPLLAILKSRRARERVETKDQGAGLEKENVVMREGEGERRQKNKPFAARPRDVSVGSRAGRTPEDAARLHPAKEEAA